MMSAGEWTGTGTGAMMSEKEVGYVMLSMLPTEAGSWWSGETERDERITEVKGRMSYDMSLEAAIETAEQSRSQWICVEDREWDWGNGMECEWVSEWANEWVSE